MLMNDVQKEALKQYLTRLQPLLKSMHKYCMDNNIHMNMNEVVTNLLLHDEKLPFEIQDSGEGCEVAKSEIQQYGYGYAEDDDRAIY